MAEEKEMANKLKKIPETTQSHLVMFNDEIEKLAAETKKYIEEKDLLIKVINQLANEHEDALNEVQQTSVKKMDAENKCRDALESLKKSFMAELNKIEKEDRKMIIKKHQQEYVMELNKIEGRIDSLWGELKKPTVISVVTKDCVQAIPVTDFGSMSAQEVFNSH